MRSLLFLVIVTLLSQVYAFQACELSLTCEDNPHKGKYYIGFTHKDARNILICKKYLSNACIARDRYGNCRSYGGYMDCYKRDGTYQENFFAQLHSYQNPFTKLPIPSKPTKVNIKSNKCYYDAKGKNPIPGTVDKNRWVKYMPQKYNGYCLTPAGWCDC